MLDIDRILLWSPWVPHRGCWRTACIPDQPGLYRLRRVGSYHLDYIGETGVALRERLRKLADGVYADQMPYTAPHTAAPALWALRQKTGNEYEVSVAPISGTTQWRKGLEAIAISLHRQQFGQSPTVNFGRMPEGFRKSSSYSLKLVQAGKVLRGGPCTEAEPHHAAGLPPAGPLTGGPQESSWGGHNWSGWQSLGPAMLYPNSSAQGLYRLRDVSQPGLLYIGQGIVAERLLDHLRKSRTSGNPQGNVFRVAERLECSWVLNDGVLSIVVDEDFIRRRPLS